MKETNPGRGKVETPEVAPATGGRDRSGSGYPRRDPPPSLFSGPGRPVGGLNQYLNSLRRRVTRVVDL